MATLAATLGIATGLAEYPLLLLRRALVHRWLGVGPDALWMAPLGYAALFVGSAVVLYGILRFTRLRDRALQLVAALLTFVVAASLLFIFHPAIHKLAIVLVAAGATRLASKPLAHAWPDVRWRATALATALLIVVMAAVLLWRRATEAGTEAAIAARPVANADAPNVLLLILDTVRAASLGLYGHHRETSPVLERLARRGVTFERAYSSAPWTLPSHATIFTGRHPHEFQADWWQPLRHRWPTLGEVFQRAGYATAGFVANTVNCSAESGLERGFDTYRDHPVSLGSAVMSTSLGRALAGSGLVRRLLGADDLLGRKRASAVNAEALAWVGEHSSRPWFAFLNYFDAHEPYVPGADFAGRFSAPMPRSTPLGRLWNGGHPFARPKPFDGDSSRMLAAYEESIAELDSVIGVLLDSLPGGRRTIIIVTSDHGEEFGEHGWFTHGLTLYPMALHVPLVVVDDAAVPAGLRVPAITSLRDLAATIVDLAGLEERPEVGGRSLARYWGDAAGEEFALAELSWVPAAPRGAPASFGDGRSLIVDSTQFIWRGDSTGELLRLDADHAGVILKSGIDPSAPEAAWYADALRRLIPDSLWQEPKPTGFSATARRAASFPLLAAGARR